MEISRREALCRFSPRSQCPSPCTRARRPQHSKRPSCFHVYLLPGFCFLCCDFSLWRLASESGSTHPHNYTLLKTPDVADGSYPQWRHDGARGTVPLNLPRAPAVKTRLWFNNLDCVSLHTSMCKWAATATTNPFSYSQWWEEEMWGVWDALETEQRKFWEQLLVAFASRTQKSLFPSDVFEFLIFRFGLLWYFSPSF